MRELVAQRPASLPLSMACRALGLNRSGCYVKPQPHHRTQTRNGKTTAQPRCLSEEENAHVLSILTSETYCDQPPQEVYHALLESGQYLCSISTMHRLLRKQRLNGDRRAQRAISPQPVPRLKATRPNEVWTWDITKLPLQTRGIYLSLYVVMDLYSRYIVAWMLSRKENSALAQQLMREAHERYQIRSLTLHQDRGAPMIANAYLDLLAELSITASHSRPRVSNDNAMSESQFKTMKYQPDYPRRFDSIEHARAWCEDYVDWYNFRHHHIALNGFTPSQVFTEQHQALAKARQDVLDWQYRQHPERFVKGKPVVKLPPLEVFINPVTADDGKHDSMAAVNFPTMTKAKSMLT